VSLRGVSPATPTAAPHPADRRREWAALLALMLGYVALFAAYYPPISGIEDEVSYVNQAVIWSRGAVSADGAGLPELPEMAALGGRLVPTRHPGRSLVALPFLVLGGGRALFASGLVLHLALTGIGAAVLARLGRSPLWAALLLLHPTLAIYSRTIMADAAAGTGLLLAALALTSPGRFAPVAAGLAVALGALMRYHAALALPLVALAFRTRPGRAHPGRDAAACLLAGTLAGGLIVAYNVALYGAPVPPVAGRYGVFSTAFVGPHLRFYAAALLVLWPGMLLAPWLDRSPLRGLVRGVIVLFLGPLLFYYFHDRTARPLETLIVGQRLLQIALPLWIVSYAGVVDDWIAAPLRGRLGRRGREALVALGCAGLLAANGVAFARHQHHLDALRAARDAIAAQVPAGSLILTQGAVYKILGIPVDVPAYRLRPYQSFDRPTDDPATRFDTLGRTPRPWYLATLSRTPGAPLDPPVRSIIDHFRMERLPVDSPLATLHVCRPAPPEPELHRTED
jgi:hypothetical protein